MEVFYPYPGVALAVCARGSVLIGAPADSFKAVKQLCAARGLPFPRTLVAPPTLLANTVPQFVPEFFLYDYLFVYGAAFHSKRRKNRLQIVMRPQQLAAATQALRMTLTGPSTAELEGYASGAPHSGLDAPTIAYLTAQSAHMAIKVEGVPQPLESLVDFIGFDSQCCASLLGGELNICQTADNSLSVRCGGEVAEIHLQRPFPVVPFLGLPAPSRPSRPQTFAVQTLGCRSGFDVSGPTTGFLLWLHGRALLLDGPPGTRILLQQQGIALDDLDGLILSHCHEDHMGAFVEMVLSGRPLKVYTTEPIYQSALLKLAGYLNISSAAAAQYIDYVCVVPEQPQQILGASLTFFYTVHAIPTLGVRIELIHRGRTYQCQISGDQLHHAGLLQMRQRGQLSWARYQAMRQLVPAVRREDSLYFVDAGESLIHGHPGDFTRNPNELIFYHCPNTDYTRSFGRPVANPGDLHVLLEEPRACALPPARLWRALQALQLSDPAWLTQILHNGRWTQLRTGESFVTQTATGRPESLCVVVSGQLAEAPPTADSWPATTWGAGDLFGHLGPELAVDPATKHALTPCELFCVDSSLIDQYIGEAGLGDRLRRLCQLRSGALPSAVAGLLSLQLRQDLCRQADLRCFTAQQPIFGSHGALGDHLLILLEGALELGPPPNPSAPARPQILGFDAADPFVGEACLGAAAADRAALEVRAHQTAWCAVFDGAMVRRIASMVPELRQRLEAAEQRRKDLP
jgi:hypothetical protein